MAATAAAPVPKPAANPEPKPATASIAILPFTNMSGDPEQEYFSDGISEDIITDLSKIAGLTVIARNSSFTYKGRAVDVRTVGRELGVASVLEGSIRRAGQRVRITAQLIDAENGAHLWADRYDRDLTDIFEVQDDVTRRIVGALKVTLGPTERESRPDGGGPVNVEAYEASMRAREVLLGPNKNRENFDKARKLFIRALELDPNFAKAYAGLAFAYMFDYQNRWSDNPDASIGLAKEYAERAIEKDPKEALAHAVAAVVATFSRDIDRAQAEIDIALSLNPNMAMAYNIKGGTRIYLGRPEEAIPLIERAMRLDPATNQQFLHFLGMANLLAGRYETAAAALRERIRLTPNTDFSRSLLASALGHLGQIEEARRVWQELTEINPKYSFEEHLGRLPFKHEADAQRLAEGLQMAGVAARRRPSHPKSKRARRSPVRNALTHGCFYFAASGTNLPGSRLHLIPPRDSGEGGPSAACAASEDGGRGAGRVAKSSAAAPYHQAASLSSRLTANLA